MTLRQLLTDAGGVEVLGVDHHVGPVVHPHDVLRADADVARVHDPALHLGADIERDARHAIGTRRHAAVEQVRDAEEPRDECGDRPLVQLLGAAQLLEPAGVHDADPVGHRHGLVLVVGHVDERDPDLGLDPLELELHLLAQLEIERAERLIEEEDPWPIDQRPGQRHALLLPARHLRRLPALVPRELHELEHLPDARSHVGIADPLPPRAERDVLEDVEVGKQRVALEDRVDVAPIRGEGRHVAPAKLDRAGGRLLEPGDHPQRRRLAATRRAEQREELATLDLERQVVDRHEIAEPLRDALQPDVDVGDVRGLPRWPASGPRNPRVSRLARAAWREYRAVPFAQRVRISWVASVVPSGSLPLRGL
jgi:hypothetical protein